MQISTHITPSTAQVALDTFRDDLVALGAPTPAVVDQRSISADFATASDANVAQMLLRSELQLGTGATGGVQLLTTSPNRGGSPIAPPSAMELTAALNRLDGVAEVRHLPALNMYAVMARDAAAAQRLQTLLNDTIAGAVLAIDVNSSVSI